MPACYNNKKDAIVGMPNFGMMDIFLIVFKTMRKIIPGTQNIAVIDVGGEPIISNLLNKQKR